jgi:hypothetical protein
LRGAGKVGVVGVQIVVAVGRRGNPVDVDPHVVLGLDDQIRKTTDAHLERERDTDLPVAGGVEGEVEEAVVVHSVAHLEAKVWAEGGVDDVGSAGPV